MQHILRALTLIAVTVLVSPGVADDTSQRLADRTLGNPAAPVTILEYSSLTCPHCADFHRNVLPQIKSAYIDSGQVNVIFKDFPLETRAFAAAMIARCVDPEKYYGFLDLLFRDQQAWATSTDPLRDLKLRAQLAGLSNAAVDQCLKDQTLVEAIQKGAEQGRTAYAIDSTPTLIINGRKVRGAATFEVFRETIEEALKNPASPAPGSATGR